MLGYARSVTERGTWEKSQMSVIALFAWLATVSAGLVLLIIWIIEYDPEFQSAAATRLPVPVISLHAFLGLSGLMPPEPPQLPIEVLFTHERRLSS